MHHRHHGKQGIRTMQKTLRYSVPLLGLVALALSGCGTTHPADDRTTSAPPATQAALDGPPAEFVPWLVRAGSICPQIGPPLLAAQVDEESGFEPHEPGPTGTSGYSQLHPVIWAAFGSPVDPQGNPVGPAGTGDPNRVADSVMALGNYMCFLSSSLDFLVSDGAVTGTDNPAELYLAAFTGGLSAVTSERGFPTNSDLIRAQVDEVLAAETEYRWIQ